MASGTIMTSLSGRCPQIDCGELLNDEAARSERVCVKCGAGITICSSCSTANRLLAVCCRGCGIKLSTEVWPCHPGLRATIPLRAMNFIRKTRAPFPIHLGAPAIASPVAVSGLIVVPLVNGSIQLVSEYTGRRFGSLSAGREIVVTPALQQGSLLIAAGGTVHCYDLARYLDRPSERSERPVWSFDSGRTISQPLLVDERAVYTISQCDKRAALHALSLAEGWPVWKEPPEFESGAATPPLLVNDRIIVISLSGEAFFVNRDNGLVEQSFSINRDIEPQIAPFVDQNRIILTDKRHVIFEVVPGNGSGPLINDLHAVQARVTSLAAAGDLIAVGHMAGLMLLDSRGHRRWSVDDIDSVSVTPIIAEDTIFALDSAGNGLLFNALKANPVDRVRLFAGAVGPPPLITETNIIAVTAAGDVVAIECR